MEVRELLSEYDFPGDDTPVIRGSALKALEGDAEWEKKVVELAEALDVITSYSIHYTKLYEIEEHLAEAMPPRQQGLGKQQGLGRGLTAVGWPLYQQGEAQRGH